MSNFRLHKTGGTTQDLEVLTVTGWQASQRNMRLAQAPGGSQAFVVGRGTRLAVPVRLRVLVDEADEATARSTLTTITSFARESVMLSRIDSSGNESQHTRLHPDGPLAGVTPEPLHMGGESWSALLELRPLKGAHVETPDNLTTNASDPIVTNASDNILVFS